MHTATPEVYAETVCVVQHAARTSFSVTCSQQRPLYPIVTGYRVTGVHRHGPVSDKLIRLLVIYHYNDLATTVRSIRLGLKIVIYLLINVFSI